MSWPSDGRPRYKVASVTGYASLTGHGGRFHQPSTTYTVLDRGYCYREVLVPGRRTRVYKRRTKAERVAAELEAGFPLNSQLGMINRLGPVRRRAAAALADYRARVEKITGPW